MNYSKPEPKFHPKTESKFWLDQSFDYINTKFNNTACLKIVNKDKNPEEK